MVNTSRHDDCVNGDVAKTGDTASLHCCISVNC